MIQLILTNIILHRNKAQHSLKNTTEYSSQEHIIYSDLHLLKTFLGM